MSDPTKMSATRCVQCGEPVEEDREVYHSPTCHTCLPPPEALPVTPISPEVEVELAPESDRELFEAGYRVGYTNAWHDANEGEPNCDGPPVWADDPRVAVMEREPGVYLVRREGGLLRAFRVPKHEGQLGPAHVVELVGDVEPDEDGCPRPDLEVWWVWPRTLGADPAPSAVYQVETSSPQRAAQHVADFRPEWGDLLVAVRPTDERDPEEVELHLLGFKVILDAPTQIVDQVATCYMCGCTDEWPCWANCCWVTANLCSECAAKQEEDS